MKTDKAGIAHLSESEIVERGWTKSGVAKFLGEPDWRPNFRAYGQTMQWRLYREERVLSTENTDDWKIWRVKSEKRRESARLRAFGVIAANQERKQAVQAEEEAYEKEMISEYIDDIYSIDVHFTCKLPTLEKLRQLGEKNWVPSPNQDPSFKETKEEHSDRVTVNYLRHHCTNYDDILYNYNINYIGYPILSKKVHKLIAKKFPELKESCDNRIIYSSNKSFSQPTYSHHEPHGVFYDTYESKQMTSPEMMLKRSQTMVSQEEQERLGLVTS